MGLYFQGLTMGLAYVAPIGMQNLFVINSALTRTRRNALITAVIVIFFDIVLSLACFFGIGALMQAHPWLQTVVLFGMFTCAMLSSFQKQKSKSRRFLHGSRLT